MKDFENLSTYLPHIDFNMLHCIMKLYKDLQEISMFFKKGERTYENVYRAAQT